MCQQKYVSGIAAVSAAVADISGHTGESLLHAHVRLPGTNCHQSAVLYLYSESHSDFTFSPFLGMKPRRAPTYTILQDFYTQP